MKSKRLGYVLGLVLAFTIGLTVSPALRDMRASASAEPERPDLQYFWRAWDLAQQHFVYRDAVDPEKMVYGAIRGMIDALGDDGHSRFLTPEDVRTERSALSGRFEGIGAEVNIRNGRPIVVAPIEGSPAERAGLRPGDTIVMVDGEDVTALSLSELVAKVRGPRGSVVRLTIIHPGDSSTTEVAITRENVQVRSVSWALVPGTTVGHIRINRFGANATADLKAAVEGARGAGADRLVVDLRNNPGGLLHEAVSSTSQFLTEGDVVLEEDSKGDRKPYPVQRGGVATEIPTVVLINRGSASSSEIFAGAFQDHKRGLVVGERSFGTGTVLTPFDLGDGSQMYLGTRQWLTPAGRAIRKVGIKPDVAVQLPPEARPLSPREERGMTVAAFQARNDAQLLRAIELLEGAPAELAPAA